MFFLIFYINSVRLANISDLTIKNILIFLKKQKRFFRINKNFDQNVNFNQYRYLYNIFLYYKNSNSAFIYFRRIN